MASNQFTVLGTYTANQYKGYSFLITSGTQLNKQGCILYNSTNIINTDNSIGGTPAVGDAYAITLLSTVDGTHPSSQGHI